MSQRSKSGAPIDYADRHTPRSASDILGNAPSFGLGHGSDILAECGLRARRIPLLGRADCQPATVGSLPMGLSFRLPAEKGRQVACAPQS